MDGDALHLKPFVTIDQQTTEPDVPREDQAIRPYSDDPSDRLIDENNHGSEMFSELDGFYSRGRILEEENMENNGKVENAAYTVVIIRDYPLSCGIVIVDNSVFYQTTEWHKCVDEKIILEIPGKTQIERRLKMDIQNMMDIVSNGTCKFAEETVAETPNCKNSGGHPTHYPLHSLEAELSDNLTKSVLKVSGKRQRRKKLSDLLGAFDTFHNLNPAPISVVVFPVSRQNIILSQGSSEQVPQEPSLASRPPLERRPWPPETVYDRPWAVFSQELYRLGTFLGLSSNFPVFALSLARAGFICLPDGAIVCYFCGVQRDQWNVGDSPLEVHRQLNPNCSVITGVNHNNTPVTTLNADELQRVMETWSLSGPSLLSGGGRDSGRQTSAAAEGDPPPLAPQVTSPENFPRHNVAAPQNEDITEDAVHQPPGSEAQVSGPAHSQASAAAATAAGPANSNQTNQNVAISNSPASGSAGSGQATRNAVANNAELNQQQSTTSSTGETSSDSNPSPANARVARIFDGTAQPEAPSTDARSPSPAGGARTDQQVVTYQQLGIITDSPKRADMATVNARVGTFRTWPSTHTQTPLALAEAGFYYAGYADCGRCFHCGGGLKNWEPIDNPWVEHARWFDKCAYVKQCQGQEFIDIVLELNRQGERQQISFEQVKEEMRNRRAGRDHLESAVDPAVSAVLHIGYSQEAVDTAVQRLQTEGHTLAADRLIDYLEADGAVAAEGVENSAETGDLTGQVEELVSQNNEIRQQRQCKICLDKEVCVVFLPCGHLVCCSECAPALRNCPMCRQRIKGRVRAFPI